MSDVVEFQAKISEDIQQDNPDHVILAYSNDEETGYHNGNEQNAGAQLIGLIEQVGAKNTAVIVVHWTGRDLRGEQFKWISVAALTSLRNNNIIPSPEKPKRSKQKKS